MTQAVGVRDAAGRFVDTFEIHAQLTAGTGSPSPVTVGHGTTVGELKCRIELACGIPADVQRIAYGHRAVLTDRHTLGELCVLPGARLPVRAAYGWEALVDSSLRGDSGGVLRAVATAKETGGTARRRFVAMFIAAHKGFHYLVDRMLCEGADPDTQTPSGRTALHAACAMGNTGCRDSLLRHGASVGLRDSSGRTAAQTAVSCGRPSIQPRLVPVHDSGAATATGEIPEPCAWSASPRFPRSKLGCSVTPTRSLQELAISAGPALMITAWSGREHHHRYLGKRPRSGEAAVMLPGEGGAARPVRPDSSLGGGTGDSLPRHKAVTGPYQETWSVPAGEAASHEPLVARSVRLHDRLRPASSQAADRQTGVEHSSVRSVKSTAAKTHSVRPASGMAKYSSSHGVSVPAIKPPNTHRYPTQTTPDQLVDDDRADALGDAERMNARKKVDFIRGEINNNQPPSGADLDQSVAAVDTTGNGSYSGGSCHSSTHKIDPKELTSLRIDYLNDRLRDMVGLPVRHPQRLEFMTEGENGRLARGNNAPAAKRTSRRPTPEENRRAFEEWLASKTQEAGDRRLVKRVGEMLDDAFGKKDDSLAAGEGEDQPQRRAQLNFEAWLEKKAQEKQHASTGESVQREDRKTAQLAARLGGATTVDSWLAGKLRRQRRERSAESQRELARRRLKTEREQAAEGAFQQWCTQKEREELQMLRSGPESGARERRPKSGGSRGKAPLRGGRAQAQARPARSHSAPPRRQTPPRT